MPLDHKVPVVTVRARGIGLAIATRYVVGVAKAVIADIDVSADEAAASTLDGAR
jgi:NAD(P)-dependent dehydrogenase (short-subunit alcohol dehydrogenase family)